MTTPNFKDFVAADVSKTFLNPDEFATWHNFDGTDMWIVITENTNNDSPLQYAEGIFVLRKTVYADPQILGYRPEEEQIMPLDGRDYRVASMSDEFGMYVINLEANVE